MSKDKLIPELRFPEFEGDGEWIYKRLGETGKVITGKTPSTKDASLWNGEILFITPTDIDENQKYQLVTNRTIVRNRKLNILPEGSIAYTCIASIGKMSITAKESVTNQQINSIVVNANYHNEFIYYSLLHITPFIKSRPATSTLPIVNKTEFSAFRIGVPIPQEQQKIASCLSSLDELIAAHNDKLDALKDHKKGMLQNLFPQEGETVPKIRFPEFEGDGEWVEDDIGTLFKFKQGVQVPVGNQFPEQGDDMVRFIRIIDITSNNEPPRYIQHPGDSHIISKDDLFMIRYGTPGLISIGFEGVIANNLFRLIWKSEKRNQPKFWFYAFQRLESFIYNLSSSSSMPAISFSTLEGLKIGFPPTIEEQQKIASCLSALDELITSQQEKIDQLQQHKKGLMQGLFPKIES